MSEATTEIKISKNPVVQKLVDQEVISLHKKDPNLQVNAINSTARDRVAGQLIRARLRKEVKTAKEMSMTDELTGLSNRRWFEDDLRRKIATSKRTNQPLYLLYIDFDDFKRINTTFGHNGGDAVLKLVAQMKTRPDEPISRNGGDEFVQLMEHEGITINEIAKAIERHKTSVLNNSRILLEKAPVVDREADPKKIVRETTLSIGIAKYQGEDPKEFIRKANEALLYAKAQGKNTAFIAETNSTDGNLTFKQVQVSK